MPLTFAERGKYLRDRTVNAVHMIRHGNFRLFWESLVFEINHGKNLLKMRWHLRREAVGSESQGSAYVNRTKVLPPSWRPTVYRAGPPTPLPHKSTELAVELARIKSKLQPPDAERRSKWPRLRF